MPHNLYLHSALVQSGRMLPGEVQRCRRERLLYHNIEGGLALAGGGPGVAGRWGLRGRGWWGLRAWLTGQRGRCGQRAWAALLGSPCGLPTSATQARTKSTSPLPN